VIEADGAVPPFAFFFWGPMKFLEKAKLLFSNTAWDKFLSDWLAGNDLNVNTSSDVIVSGDNSLKFTAVFGCLRVLAETFTSVPLHEYKKEIKSADREMTDDTGILELFRGMANDEMSGYNLREMGMYQINLGGNLVCQRVQSSMGKLIGLNPIDWTTLRIERNKETKKIQYIINNKTDAPLSRKQVFHIPGPSINGIVGLSPIEYAAQAIRLGMTYEKFGVNFYKNGAFATGIFKKPGTLDDVAYKRLKDDLKENYQGLLNTGTPILAEDGLDFVPFQMKLVDAELLASKKFQVEDICRIYRVPLHLVQNLDKATNNNIEHQSLEFVMYTMLPWFKRWEENINTQLLTPDQRKQGYYFEFNIAGLLRGDQKSMAEAFAQGRQWGWLSVNDIRRLLNLNSIGSTGDIYLQPMNMVEAGTPPADIGKAPAAQGSSPASNVIRQEIENLIEASTK
jgi:HK97 family phage portal protein